MKKKSVSVALLLLALTFIVCALAACGEDERIFSGLDFVFYDNGDGTAAVVALTKEGREKELLVLPERFNGKKITSIGSRACDKVLASENLKKFYVGYLNDQLYIPNGDSKTCMNVPNAYVVCMNDFNAADLTCNGFICKKIAVMQENYLDYMEREDADRFIERNVRFNMYYSPTGNSTFWQDYVEDGIPYEVQNTRGEEIIKIYLDEENDVVWDGTADGNISVTAIMGWDDGTFWTTYDVGACAYQLGGYVDGAQKTERLVLPRTIKGAVITQVRNGAFRGDTVVKEVVFPDIIETIGYNAFNDCTSLEKITFGENTEIESFRGAFCGCTSLKSFIAPDTLKVVAGFDGCTSLETLDLNKATHIEGFCGCSALKSVDLKSVTYICAGSFSGCDNLKTFTADKDNEKIIIDGMAVYVISWRKELVILGGEEKKLELKEGSSVNPGALHNNHTLEEFKVKNGYLYESTFKGCDRLKKVELEDVSLDCNVFLGCAGLETVVIRSDRQHISDGAFSGTPPSCAFYVPADKLEYYRNNAESMGISGTIQAIE